MEIWFVCWMRYVIHLTRSLFCQENSQRFSTAVMFHFKHPVDICGEIINILLQPLPILALHFLPSSGQEIWSTCYIEWLNAWFWCKWIGQTCSFEGFHILLAMWCMNNFFHSVILPCSNEVWISCFISLFRGTFCFERTDGSHFDVRIPPFSLESNKYDKAPPTGYPL